jgi:hypothetical protein
MNIHSVPREVLLLIFEELDDTSISRCSAVCSKWSKIINSSEKLWKHRFESKYGSVGYLFISTSHSSHSFTETYLRLQLYINGKRLSSTTETHFSFYWHIKLFFCRGCANTSCLSSSSLHSSSPFYLPTMNRPKH